MADLDKKIITIISKEYPKDLKLDYSNINQLPVIMEKYLNMNFVLMMEINGLENSRAEMYGSRYKYYKEDYAFTLTSAEIKNYIECDPLYLDIKKNLGKIEVYLKQLNEIISELKSLQYIAKTQLEYEKMIGGN